MKRNMHRVIYRSHKKHCGDDNKHKKIDLTPDDIFNKMLTTINKIINNPASIRQRHPSEFIDKHDAIHFKQICESLNPTDDKHNQIKSIIINQYATKDIHKRYTQTLQTLHNDTITDLTINFPNGETFKCLKMIIQKIPYFDMIIRDCVVDDSIILNDSYEYVMVIMNMLYQNEYFKGTIENIVDVLLLSDKYLMLTDLVPLLDFFNKNVNDIIKYLIDNNEFDKILSVYKYFDNANPNGTPKYMSYSLYKINLGEFMFNIDNWNKKFDNDIIIKVITQTKRYDLLNILNVNPLKILKLLSNIDLKNNTYFKLGKYAHTNSSELHYGLPIQNSIYDNVIVITSYYPKFEYTIYERVRCVFENVENNIINFNFTKYCPDALPIGSRLIIDTNLNTNNYHTITKIIKCHDGQCIEVQEADDFGGFNHSPFPYILHFDKPVEKLHNTNIWTMEKGEHIIDI